MSLISVKLYDNHINSFYEVQYLYTATSAYLIGIAPTVLTWLYLLLGGLLVVVLCVATRPRVRSLGDKDKNVDGGSTITNDEVSTASASECVKYARIVVLQGPVALVLIAAALAINYGFVNIVYFVKPAHLTVIQFAFAVIKAVFGIIIVPTSAKLLPKASRHLHMIVMAIVMNDQG
jgi:hypothetical protein